MSKFRVLTILAFCLYGTLLFGCGNNENSAAQPEDRRQVKVLAVHSTQTESSERVPGNVRAATDATIEAKITGRILKILVKEGDPVKADQILIELDSHEIQARLDQALASQRQADQDLKRFSQLLPAGAATKQEYDAADARAMIARAGVAEANAMIGYSRIQAPYDGIITKKMAQEGDLATPGKPLLKTEKQDLYQFEVDIPESLAAGVKNGDALVVNLSGSESELQGTVVEVSPTTDPNSRTLHVKLNLPASPLLRSGQFGYVLVPVQKRAELRIPSAALLEHGQIETVFVVRNGIALLRLVRTGRRDLKEVQILSGLLDGETIVIDGAEGLKDGQKVEIL